MILEVMGSILEGSMKRDEQHKARCLRADGMSVKKIASELEVSVSSVSRWVRDVQLSDFQKRRLAERNPASRFAQSRNTRETWRQRRLEFQESGRKRIRDGATIRYVAGCMLYWAEGGKNKNQLRFSNSDSVMMMEFWRFLKEGFQVSEKEVRITVRCYSGNGISIEGIKKYWEDILGIEVSRMEVNVMPISSSGKRKGKIPYGVCRLDLNRTDVVQAIFGSIQEFAGKNIPEWLG